MMAPDGSDVTRITDCPSSEFNPFRLPDGSQVTFSSGQSRLKLPFRTSVHKASEW